MVYLKENKVLEIITAHAPGLIGVKSEYGSFAISGVLWAEGTWMDSAGRVLRHSRDVVERALAKFKDAAIDIEHNNKTVGRIKDVQLSRDSIYKIIGIGTMNKNPGTGKGFSPEFIVDAVHDTETDVYHVTNIRDVKFVSVVKTPSCKVCPVQAVSRMSAREQPSCAITCSNGSNETKMTTQEEKIANLEAKIKDIETRAKSLETVKTTLEQEKTSWQDEKKTLTQGRVDAETASQGLQDKLDQIKSQFSGKPEVKPEAHEEGHICEATGRLENLESQFKEFKNNTERKLQTELESSLQSKFAEITKLNADVSTKHISDLDVPIEVKLKMAEALYTETTKFSDMKRDVEDKANGSKSSPALISEHSSADDVTSLAKEYVKQLGFDNKDFEIKLPPGVTA